MLFKKKPQTKTEDKKLQLPIPVTQIGEKNSVISAIESLRSIGTFPLNTDEDLVLEEGSRYINDEHVRTDYIIHPKSAIRRTDDGRLSIEARRADRLDDLTNRYFNLKFGKSYFGEVPKRFLTQDGWELFTLRGQEVLETQSQAYEQCRTCHEVMPLYWEYTTGQKPEINEHHPIPVQETRTFKLRPVLQALIANSGMVITKVDHPCYHSLQDLIRPSNRTVSVDPPSFEPVFPKDISY